MKPLFRNLWNRMLARSGEPQEAGLHQHAPETPFQRVPVADRARSTFFDPDEGLHTQEQRNIYIFHCGHISADPVGAGRCSFCGRWSCATCLSVCASCGSLLCNHHAIHAGGKQTYCLHCLEQLEENLFFTKTVETAKAILLLPFKE